MFPPAQFTRSVILQIKALLLEKTPCAQLPSTAKLIAQRFSATRSLPSVVALEGNNKGFDHDTDVTNWTIECATRPRK